MKTLNNELFQTEVNRRVSKMKKNFRFCHNSTTAISYRMFYSVECGGFIAKVTMHLERNWYEFMKSSELETTKVLIHQMKLLRSFWVDSIRSNRNLEDFR